MSRVALASLTALAALGLVLATGDATAALLPNGSFEEGDNPPTSTFETLSNGSTAIAGWTVSGGTIDWVSSAYWQAAEGTHSLDLNGLSTGAITLGTNVNLAAGMYNLSFALSGNPEGAPAIKELVVNIDGNQSTRFYNTAGNTLANMSYQSVTITFPFAGGVLPLSFISNTSGDFYGPVIDDVALNLVPIPGAALLFGSALVGLGVLRRRNGSSNAVMAAA